MFCFCEFLESKVPAGDYEKEKIKDKKNNIKFSTRQRMSVFIVSLQAQEVTYAQVNDPTVAMTTVLYQREMRELELSLFLFK